MNRKCYAVNEQGQTYRCNGTWGPCDNLTLLFPNVAAMKVFFTHVKLKPWIRWM